MRRRHAIEALKLLAIARKDLIAARVLLESEEIDDEPAGFHLQQAAEKTLKAWLCLKGINYPLTHDLRKLFDMLEKSGEALNVFWPLVELNPFSVQFRYDSCEEPFDGYEAYALTERLVVLVEGLAKEADGH